MIRAFTGPSIMISPEQRIWVVEQMMQYSIDEGDTWRSGCAKGVDTFAAWLGLNLGVRVQMFVPAAPHNEDLVEVMAALHDRVEVINCPQGRSFPESYRQRNRSMVSGADQLVAFVWKDEFYRSGEWMTINLARSSGVAVHMEVLPGGMQ